MSRKAGLAKKIAHTLMAMSIVYSSGINIVVNEVYAAEKTKDITSSDPYFSEKSKNGNGYDVSGGITDGEDISLTGKVTEADLSDKSIVVLASGGKGGDDNGSSPTTMQGSNGGDAAAKITIDESLSNVTLGKLRASSYSGLDGSAYQGAAGNIGAATAYGLQLKHDLTISVADIEVAAKSGWDTLNYRGYSYSTVGGAAGPQALAVGVQFDGGKVEFSGTKLNIEAMGAKINECRASSEEATGGGTTEAYGFRVQDGEATIALSDSIKINLSGTDGQSFDSIHLGTVNGFAGGDGGEIAGFGIESNGGSTNLDIKDIEIDNEDHSYWSSYYGQGGTGQSVDGSKGDLVAGSGGRGANATGVGIHTTGGSVNGTVGNVKLQFTGGNGGRGGSIVEGDVNKIGGSGGDGGNAYVAGLKTEGGQTQLSVDGMDLTAIGGDGGGLGNFRGANGLDSHPATVTATGRQAHNGTGGAGVAVGIDNRGGNSNVTVKDIKITAIGGKSGDSNYVPAKLSEAAAAILAAERVSGEGGEATAIGLQNTDGSLTADVQKLEITATGGVFREAERVTGTLGLDGGLGGAAAAYGVNITGGVSKSIAVAEIEVIGNGGTAGNGSHVSNYSGGAVGGTGGLGGAAAAYGVNITGGVSESIAAAKIEVTGNGGYGGNGGNVSSYKSVGAIGGTGGNGGTGTVYGVSNSGGLLKKLSVGSISAAATGGAGGIGFGVYKDDSSAEAVGIGGNGGNGGSAYAYGVWGSGAAAFTAVEADTITATATAGAGGLGAAANPDPTGTSSNGAATAGSDGSRGEEAKAYGVYADKGAVIDLSAKTSGKTLKIGARAADGSVIYEAYAVYADNATVLFGSNAELNGDGISGINNALVTGLNSATLGFGGTSADRTVAGGSLQLNGSNAFRFTTDLVNNKTDSMTFETIANNGAQQYIQIGYEEAFKDALSEADIVTVNGSATVLTINNLNGQNLNNFTGQASNLDNPLERFKVTPTVEVADNKVNITEIALTKENAPSETAMTFNDAQMALRNVWRSEGNNVMKRMGELRSDKEAAKGGVWARYYRGELSADSAYDREFSQDYTAFQGGIDKVQDYKGGKLYTGIAVNRIDSNAGYTAGSGDLSSTGVGVYASWLGSKGHYIDVIARGSKLTNDFKLVDLSGNAAKADYDTWAYGISAEYGYRQNLNAGWFVEPQAELSLGHLGSADYTTSNEVSVKQDSVNSAVTRIGILGGKEFTIVGRPSNAYVKASLLHDFGGNGGATGYYGNDSLALQTGDLTGTWYEIGLGANLGIAKNSNLYFDALKTFNGTVRTDWQFNAGLRFTF